MLNHELIFNGSLSFHSPVEKNSSGHLGRLVPSGGTDIASCCGLGGAERSRGGGSAGSRLGFLEGGGLGNAGGASHG